MKTKKFAIKNGRGEVKGYIIMYWSEALGRFVSIPEGDEA